MQACNGGKNSWREELTPKQKLEAIINESKARAGTSADIDITVKPVWFDQKRYERAQKTVNEIFYTPLVISSFTGLLLLVQVPGVLKPLLKTRKSESVVALMYRYLDTTRHVRGWYESKNIFDPEDAGFKSIKQVRAMHKNIFNVMNNGKNAQNGHSNNDAANRTEKAINNTEEVGSPAKDGGKNPEMWVNQYYMVMTQFAFMGLMVLFPAKCGGHAANEQDIMDIVYLWRILAYLIGVEDRYNLCTYDNLADEREFLSLYLDKMHEHLKEERDSVGTAMAEGIALAYEELLTASTFNTLDRWWRPFTFITGGEPKRLTWAERGKTFVFSFYFDYVFKIRAAMPYVTKTYKVKLDKFVANKEKHAKAMVKKYKQLKYE